MADTYRVEDLQVVVTDNKVLTISGTLEVESNDNQVELRNGVPHLSHVNETIALPIGMCPPRIKSFTITAVACRFADGRTLAGSSMSANIDSAVHYWEAEIARTVAAWMLSVWTPRYHEWAEDGVRHEQDLQDEEDEDFHGRYLEDMDEESPKL